MLFFLVAEASCRSAIDAARNIVADLGPTAVARSGGLTELAKCSDTNSERGCKSIMVKKFRLALPIQRSYLKTDDPSLRIPVLPMTSWANFLATNNCWHVLCGLTKPDKRREEAILAKFWGNFKKKLPHARGLQVGWRRCVAAATHGSCCAAWRWRSWQKTSSLHGSKFSRIAGPWFGAFGERQSSSRCQKTLCEAEVQLHRSQLHHQVLAGRAEEVRLHWLESPRFPVFVVFLRYRGTVDVHNRVHRSTRSAAVDDDASHHRRLAIPSQVGKLQQKLPQLPKEQGSAGWSWNLSPVSGRTATCSIRTNCNKATCVAADRVRGVRIWGTYTLPDLASCSRSAGSNVGFWLLPHLAPRRGKGLDWLSSGHVGTAATWQQHRWQVCCPVWSIQAMVLPAQVPCPHPKAHKGLHCLAKNNFVPMRNMAQRGAHNCPDEVLGACPDGREVPWWAFDGACSAGHSFNQQVHQQNVQIRFVAHTSWVFWDLWFRFEILATAVWADASMFRSKEKFVLLHTKGARVAENLP